MSLKVQVMKRFIVQCNLCRQRVESKEKETYESCRCGNLTIRGGIELGRVVWTYHMDTMTDCSVWEILEIPNKFEVKNFY